MLEKLDDVIFSNNDLVFVCEDSDVTFISDDMGLNTMYLHNINLDDDDFDDDDPETIIHVRLSVIDTNTARYVKTGKHIIIACKHSIQQDGAIGACQKMEKRNKIIFEW